MKKLYIFLTFLAFHFSFSQIVNIPDSNFKAFLLAANTTTNKIAFTTTGATVIDTNGNGEIEESEAQAINVRLYFKNNTLITDVTGIEKFVNVTQVEIGGFTNLSNLDLNNMPHLKTVFLYNLPQVNILNFNATSPLVKLDISSCPSITNFTINSPTLQDLRLTYGGGSGQLDLTNCPVLKKLYIESTQVATLNASNLGSLDNVDIRDNTLLGSVNLSDSNNITKIGIGGSGSLTSLDISNKPFLLELRVQGNSSLNTLNIQNCTKLKTIFANSNILSNINLINIPKLESLTVGDNNLTSITLGNLPLLTYLQCSNNNLTSLDLSSAPALKYLYCSHNNLTLLDFQSNPAMQALYCDNNSSLQYINVKNGSQNPIDLSFIHTTPALTYVCCDPEDINYYESIYNLSFNNVVINSYCSFTPGGIYYTIKGNTKYDFNNNGCGANDPVQPFQKLKITSGGSTNSIISNNTGDYTFPLQSGTHTIIPVLENPTYFNVTPSSLTANFPTQASPLTQNFCLTANGTHNDLEVLIIPATPAAPGFNAQYKIVYKNKGTGVQSGSVTFNYNDNVMNFSTSSIVPDSQNTGLLTWNFSNLNPFESREITVTFVLNTPTATPPLNGGDVLHFTSLVTGLTDETPADNTFTLHQTVVNSFDPNDKTCLQGASISQSQVGDYVHYLIRFENTGTANAQNVVVKDVIDTNKFDINTLIALNASHNFVTRITAPNTVEFIFENIQLPFLDATNDGYVLFKIKTKSTLNNGDSFSNTAGIYFDYNAPIITNTYVTNILTLSTSEVETADELYIYPNPVIDILTFKTKEKVIKVEVLDISGRLLRSEGVQHNSLNLSDLKPGNYFIRIYLKNSTITRKITKK